MYIRCVFVLIHVYTLDMFNAYIQGGIPQAIESKIPITPLYSSEDRPFRGFIHRIMIS